MNTALIRLLMALVVWLVKFLFNTASEESQEAPQQKVPSPPTTSQMYRQPMVQQTIPLQRTYAGINKAPSPPKTITRKPIATKPSTPTPPIPSKKRAQVLGRCSTLRDAIVVSELLQPKNF